MAGGIGEGRVGSLGSFREVGLKEAKDEEGSCALGMCRCDSTRPLIFL